MTDFNPKQGEMIIVGHRPRNPGNEREFVIRLGDIYHCKSSDPQDVSLFPWECAGPLPNKPEPIPFTHETWPKQPVHVVPRGDERASSWLMLGFHVSGIRTSSRSINFTELEANYLISFDFCQTWQPCHYVPESA